jgi:hypothetical protein
MKKTLTGLVCALGLAVLLAAPARAQFPGRGMGGNILAIPEVQKELKLDDSQVEKVTAFNTQMREKMQAAFQDLQGLEGEERQKKMQELTKTRTEETKKAVGDILKPDQAKRYQQLNLQRQGLTAVTQPDVAKELKLTDEQKEKIAAIDKDMQGKMREIFQSSQGDFQGMREKTQALRKETEEKITKELRDEQMKAWKEMLGAPFEFPPPRRPGN